MRPVEETHVTPVYQVRPDKTTSVVGIVGLAAFAWFANQWAAGVSTDSAEALRKASEALSQQERQSVELRRMGDEADRAVTTALVPIQQRLDDLRSAASQVYNRQEAERDKALVSQELAQLRASTTDNQNTLQRLVGRVEVIERENGEMARRLEQLVQAMLDEARGGKSAPQARSPAAYCTGYQES